MVPNGFGERPLRKLEGADAAETARRSINPDVARSRGHPAILADRQGSCNFSGTIVLTLICPLAESKPTRL